MKNKILIITLMYIGAISYGQTSFKKIISEYDYQICYSIAEDDNENFVVVGQHMSLSGKRDGYILKIDREGNMLKDTIFATANNRFGFFLDIKFFNNHYYIIGSEGDSGMYNPLPYNTKLWYLKIDTNMNIVSERKLNFSQDKWISYLNFIIDSDSNIIVNGSEGYFLDTINYIYIEDLFFYKLSEKGDSIKYKKYNSNGGRSCDILEKPNNSGYYAFIQNFAQSFVISGDKIFELSKDLDSVSVKAIPNNITSNFSALYLNDSVLVISGDKAADYRTIRVQTVSTESVGNSTIDYIAYGNSNWYNKVLVINSLSKNNNNLYLGGLKSPNSIPYLTDNTEIYVVKLNEDLTPIWEKYIGGDANYQPQSILATNDGGCIIVGSRHDHTVQTSDEVDIYIVKVASDGTIMWEKEITINPKINIFPNPGTDIININSDTDYSNFYLYDMFGKIVISENTKAKTINTSRLQNSIYIYRITNTQGEVLKTGKWVKQ